MSVVPLLLREDGTHGVGIAPFGNVGIGLSPLYNPTNNILEALWAPSDDGSGNSPLVALEAQGESLSSIPEIANDIQGIKPGQNVDKLGVIDLGPGLGIVLYNWVGSGRRGCFTIPDRDEFDLTEFSFFTRIGWISAVGDFRTEPWILGLMDERTGGLDNNIFRFGLEAFSGEPPNIREVTFKYSTTGALLDGLVVTNGANIVADTAYIMGFSYKDQGDGASLLNIFLDGTLVASATDLPSMQTLFDSMTEYVRPKPVMFGIYGAGGAPRCADTTIVMTDAAWMSGFISSSFTHVIPVLPFRGTAGTFEDNLTYTADKGGGLGQWNPPGIVHYIEADLDAENVKIQYEFSASPTPGTLSSEITFAAFKALPKSSLRYMHLRYNFYSDGGYTRADLSDGYIEVTGGIGGPVIQPRRKPEIVTVR